MTKKYVGRTNLDTATPEQLDKVYQNVADAVNWLYKTVRERKIKELLEETNEEEINHQ